MTTKFIGLKEFSKNISKYSKDAKVKKYRIIVMKKNIPILDVQPINPKDYVYTKLAKEVTQAEESIKNGEFYTTAEVLKELGIN